MYIKLPLALLDYIGIQEFPKPASNCTRWHLTHLLLTSLEKTNKYREAPKVTTLLFFLTLQPLIRRIFLALRFHTSFNENFTLEGLSTVNKVYAYISMIRKAISLTSQKFFHRKLAIHMVLTW